MSSSILTILEQNPTVGIAVGGALVVAAVGLTAAKALSGGEKAVSDKTTSAPKKKKKSAKSGKKKPSVAPVEQKEHKEHKEHTPAINLEEFVDVRCLLIIHYCPLGRRRACCDFVLVEISYMSRYRDCRYI